MLDKKNELQFVKASAKDVDILFAWINDPSVREQSLSNHIISYEEHTKWFSKKLADKNCFLYIVYKNQIQAGMIRFDVHDNECTVSYLVDKSQREKGVGSLIINDGIRQFINESGFSGVISAVVKTINIASLKIFERAGFMKHNADADKVNFKIWV